MYMRPRVMTRFEVEKMVENIERSGLKHARVKAVKIQNLFLQGKARDRDLIELEQMAMAAAARNLCVR